MPFYFHRFGGERRMPLADFLRSRLQLQDIVFICPPPPPKAPLIQYSQTLTEQYSKVLSELTTIENITKPDDEMSATKRQMMTWDAAADRKLLLAILAQCGDFKPDFDGISDMMGPTCTARAVQERIKKLRKLDPNDVSADSTSIAPDQATQTKTSRKRTASNSKAAEDAGSVTDNDKANGKAVVAKKTPRKRAAPKAKKAKDAETGIDNEGSETEPVAVKKTTRKRAAPKSKKNDPFVPVNIKEGPVEESDAEEETSRKKPKYNDSDVSDAPASQPIETELLKAANAAHEEVA